MRAPKTMPTLTPTSVPMVAPKPIPGDPQKWGSKNDPHIWSLAMLIPKRRRGRPRPPSFGGGRRPPQHCWGSELGIVLRPPFLGVTGDGFWGHHGDGCGGHFGHGFGRPHLRTPSVYKYIHTYIHTCIHTYIYTCKYIHSYEYVHALINPDHNWIKWCHIRTKHDHIGGPHRIWRRLRT